MNKKFFVVLSLLLRYKVALLGTIFFTEGEASLLDDIEFLAAAPKTVLIFNLPLFGKIELHSFVDPVSHKLTFTAASMPDMTLAPIPVSLEHIRLKENEGHLIVDAKAKVFGREARVSLKNLKRSQPAEIVEKGNKIKLIYDISEITFALDFEKVAIRLLGESDLVFSSASLILHKNKDPQFLVSSMIFDQEINFNFIYTPENTQIRYFFHEGILLSQLFNGLDSTYDTIVLKNLSLTNEYLSENLFSKCIPYKAYGNAFADVAINDAIAPIHAVDLPAAVDFSNDKVKAKIKLPEFKLPYLGVISQGYLTIENGLNLIGKSSLELPQIGSHPFELQALYHQGQFLLRGTINNSIAYDDYIIEIPKFVLDSSRDTLKIVGNTEIYDIKCRSQLAFTGLNKVELKLHSLQKCWRPFESSLNRSLAAIELSSLNFSLPSNQDKSAIKIMGKISLEKNKEREAAVRYSKGVQGLFPVLNVKLPAAWKVSDSFKNVHQFDDFKFNNAQFIISDNAFYDSKLRLYFNRGINFLGSLTIPTEFDLLGDFLHLASNDLIVTGTVNDNFTQFFWQAPLATRVPSPFKILTFGPVSLQFNSQNPLFVISPIRLQIGKKEFLDFRGSFESSNTKLYYSAIATKPWENMFSLKDFDMINPKLFFSLNKSKGGTADIPNVIGLEGDAQFCNTRIPLKSFGNLDIDNMIFLGEIDHFWLNELAHNVAVTKERYTILPPLELKQIALSLSTAKGLCLFGDLEMFGLHLNVECKVTNEGLMIKETLPKLIGQGIEMKGLTENEGPLLVLETKGDHNLSCLKGILKIGDLIKIYEPITISTRGCSFSSPAMLGIEQFKVVIEGHSSGFMETPNFDLVITFEKESIARFKSLLKEALVSFEATQTTEMKKVIEDIALLEEEQLLITNAEQKEIGLWALKENKRRLQEWLDQGSVIIDSFNNYRYNGLANKLDIIDVKYRGPAAKIATTSMPLTFMLKLGDAKKDIQFPLDFAHLEESIQALVKKLKNALVGTV